jgi:hypothetical protein
MLRETEELMFRLQDYEQKTKKVEKSLSEQIEKALQLEEQRRQAQEEADYLETRHGHPADQGKTGETGTGSVKEPGTAGCRAGRVLCQDCTSGEGVEMQGIRGRGVSRTTW